MKGLHKLEKGPRVKPYSIRLKKGLIIPDTSRFKFYSPLVH